MRSLREGAPRERATLGEPKDLGEYGGTHCGVLGGLKLPTPLGPPSLRHSRPLCPSRSGLNFDATGPLVIDVACNQVVPGRTCNAWQKAHEQIAS